MNKIKKDLKNMKTYGSKLPAYRPMLNSFVGNREIVQQKTITFKSGNILHCEDGPAVVWSDGSVEYFVNGFLHNENGPAIIHYYNSFVRKFWYINGVKHREDGPAVEHDNGDGKKYCEYYIDGCLHREDGPAVIHPSGTHIWYKKGIIDRTDGPAIINMAGNEFIGSQWFITNKDVTKLYKRWASKRKIEADNENFGIFRMEYKILGGSIK
jgi:hypothetical protein